MNAANAAQAEIIQLIPGQGGDPRGALRGLYRAETRIHSAIDEVCAQVDPVGAAHGLPPVGDVLLTEHRIPMAYGLAPLAAYTASIALHRILADAAVRPTGVIGQSFGEIAALVCAGAFTVAEGATAVCALNEAFRIALGRGGMVLLRAPLADTEKILARLGRPDLLVACVDSPDETIVSGPNDAVDALLALRDREADALPPLNRLAVPYASHHPDLAPVAERFRAGLEPLRQRPLACRALSPVRRRAYDDTDDLRDALADCVVRPVHLVEAFESLSVSDHLFIEIGVGAGLCRCVRGTLPGAVALAPLADPAAARDVLRTLIP
jgi:acyl transferase domain-containing protein